MVRPFEGGRKTILPKTIMGAEAFQSKTTKLTTNGADHYTQRVSACVAECSTGLSIWCSFHLHRLWCNGTQIFGTAD